MAIEGWETHDEVVWHPSQADEQHDARTLFGTEQLNSEEVNRLLERDHSRLVVWLGERGSGKTTLCVQLYERQQRGVEGTRFAGSWTLLALEQLAYLRRTSTSIPATRSGVDGDGRDVLHLALCAGETPFHLLLTDLSGEVYRRLADNQMSATEIPWLARADKVVLLVDGARLLDVGARSSTLTAARQLLERLRACELPKPGARLALLVTKWDLARADPDATRYWEPREAELLADLRALDPDAPALRVGAGARSADDGFAALCSWLLEVEPSAPEPLADFWAQPLAGELPAEAAPVQFAWPEDPRRARRPWRWRR